MIRALAEKHPFEGYIVKLHPIEIAEKKSLYMYDPLEGYDNIFIIREPFPMQVVLGCVDALFHYGSTTSFEAYIYKIPSIQLLYHAPGEFAKKTFDRVMSTYELDLGNYDLDIFASEPPKFKETPEIETYIREVFGYETGKPYSPTTIIANEILGGRERQPLELDEKTKAILRCKASLAIRTKYYKKMLKNPSEAGTYWKILKTVSEGSFFFVRDFFGIIKLHVLKR